MAKKNVGQKLHELATELNSVAAAANCPPAVAESLREHSAKLTQAAALHTSSAEAGTAGALPSWVTALVQTLMLILQMIQPFLSPPTPAPVPNPIPTPKATKTK